MVQVSINRKNKRKEKTSTAKTINFLSRHAVGSLHPRTAVPRRTRKLPGTAGGALLPVGHSFLAFPFLLLWFAANGAIYTENNSFQKESTD
jgi:hypothetical protein